MAGMMIALATTAAFSQTEPAKPAAKANPRVKLETTLGNIVIELDVEKAPITTANFLQYTRDKYYDGTIFHRVMPEFVIQGGGYSEALDEKKTGLRPGIKNEWQNGLKNVKGSLSMARSSNPDSATSQFFINVKDNANLDDGANPAYGGAAYAVFGKVVEGMDVVEKIRTTETKSDPKLPMGKVVPVTPVVIKTATVVGEAAPAAAAPKLEPKKPEAVPAPAPKKPEDKPEPKKDH